jgi:membrane protein implicated in regulation of membrane protease activity
MIWIYIAAAIFGGGFVLPALIGSLDLDTDADFDFDTDIDVDVDMDLDADADFDGDASFAGTVGGIGDWVASLLTFRAFIFFSAFFGAAGIVLTVLSYSEPVPLVTALALGGFAGVVNARLMRYLKRSEMTSHVSDQELSGTTARVVLPIGQERRGRVEIDLGGQPTYMVALPYRRDADELAPGDQVVVVEVRQGTAYVTPLPSFEGGK